MASAFSHIAVPAVLYAAFKSETVNFRVFVIASACAVLPDADILAFNFGIPYASQWGHRGFTHSLAFALSLAACLTVCHRLARSRPWPLFWLCFLSCASHPLLDAMTNGGLGVALFWPFSQERIFFPFRPIQVSPIGVTAFFSQTGLKVLASELRWVLIPAMILGIIGAALRRRHAYKQ